MKKIIYLIIVIGFFISGPVLAQEIYVDATNGDNGGSGSSSSPYQSIVVALSHANNDDTIYIKGSSTYYYHFLETITITQDNLTITNWDENPVYFDLLALMPTFDVQANGVNLDGLYFVTSQIYNSSPVGADSIKITNGYQDTVITDCVFSAGQYAIDLQGNNSNTLISGNVINGDLVGGINIVDSTDVTFQNNDVSMATGDVSIFYVINIDNSTNVNILKNKIYNTSASAIIYSKSSDNVLIANNLIYNNDDISYGVLAQNNQDIFIYNNTFYNNETGIGDNEDTNQNLIAKNNIFASNIYGIKIDYNNSSIFDYNLFNNNTCIALVTSYNSIGSCYSALADWQSDENQDLNSVENNPDFLDSDNGNFIINENSYAIDHGIEVAEVIDDYSGLSRPYGDYYDIGAYEYAYDYGINKKSKIKKVKKYDNSSKIKFTSKKKKAADKYWFKFTTLKGKKIYQKKVKKNIFTLKAPEKKGFKLNKKYKVQVKLIKNRNGVTYYGKWGKAKKFTFK